MSKDFSAKQIRSSQLLASGGIGSTTIGLMIYSASDATNLAGGTAATLTAGVGPDVFLFVSGTEDGKNIGTGVSLFGGDVVVSGTLYAERQVVEVDELVTGTFDVQGTLFVSGSSEMAGGLDLNSSRGTLAGPGGNEFIYFGRDGREIIAAQASTNQVKILSGGNSGVTPMESDYLDLAFFVSGSIGSMGTSDKGTSIFGGDLHVSGNQRIRDLSVSNDIYAGVNLYVSGNATVAGDISVDGVSNLDNTDIDGTFTMDGTAFDVNATTTLALDNTNTSNGITLNTNISGGPVSIGHTTSETTVNDNLSVTGDLAVDGVSNLDNTDIDGTFAMDGTSFDVNATTTLSLDNTNTSNGITLNTNVSGGPVSIGHTTSETTINDNLTVTGDTELGGNLAVPFQIVHAGDTHTAIAFVDDRIIMRAGDKYFLDANETSGVSTLGLATYGIDQGNDGSSLFNRVMILSGSGGKDTTSRSERGYNDLNFFVSGSKGSRGTSTMGTSVFGGDLVVSGTSHALVGISGSIMNLTDGRSYLAAGDNITITSASDGQITITGAAAGGGGTPGGSNTQLQYNNDGSFGAISTVTTDGSVVSFGDSAIVVGQDITHAGDTDTKITFGTNHISLTAGNDTFLSYAASDATVFYGESIAGSPNHVFRTTNQPVALGMSDTQVLILSGGQAVSFNEAAAPDVNFYVSGSVGLRNTATRGTSVFGGDLVVSGTSHNLMGISGSIMNLTDGRSYLAAGDNITITSASDGQITITGAAGGGGGTPGGSNTQVQFNDNGSFDGISGATTDGSAITFGDAAILVGQDITHTGDPDTKIAFGPDSFGITVGGEQLVTIAQVDGGQDYVKIGDGDDVDFQVRTLGDDNAIYARGDNDRVGIGTNDPSAKLHVAGDIHIEEATPTITVKRTNNSNNSTLEFKGSGGNTANMVHLGSSNDLVFSTHDGSDQEEILRLGSYYGSSNRQVILLSGSNVVPASVQPKLCNDLNLFVSGAIGSRGTGIKGTSVFGGDVVVSGTISVNRGQAGAGSVVTITEDGKVGIGTDTPSYKLEVGGNMAIGEYIYHRGDSDTFIHFDTDRISFDVGGKELLNINENESTISLNNDNDAINTVIKTDTKLAFAAGTPLGAGKDQVLFMSGGAATSYNEATADDVLVYFSGSRTGIGGQSANSSGRNSGDRVCVVFGGDTVFSGSIYGAGELSSGNPALHFGASTHQFDTANQFAVTDTVGNSPGFGVDHAQDVFFTVSGSIGSRGSSERGTSVFGGDVVISGTLRTGGETHITTHKYDPDGNQKQLLRFDTIGSDPAAGPNNKMIAPFNGRLVKVMVRSEDPGGNTTVGLHVAADGAQDVNIGSYHGTPQTVNMAADDTSYTFLFTEGEDYAAGDIVAISVDPTLDTGVTIATVVWEFDTLS